MALSRRIAILTIAAAVPAIAIPSSLFVIFYRPFPSDRTPEGAYMRIAHSVSDDDPKGFFAYLEQEAQWACYTLRDARKKALALVSASYPEPQRSALVSEYAPLAKAPDGSDVFAHLYVTRKWASRLRKDMSGVTKVDIDQKSERATIVTARGTRWPFRKRDNGIWGMTVFTAELVAEAEKATRDLAVVESAAADYEKLKATQATQPR